MKIRVFGIVIDVIEKQIVEALKLTKQKNSLLFFCDYSDHDFEIGHEFSSISENDQIIYSGLIKLKTVTQQYFKPFEIIPSGWKTICEFEFEESIPSIIRAKIPILESWSGMNLKCFTLSDNSIASDYSLS
jgi:hypothetical protein